MPPDMHNVRSNHVDEREASQVGEGSVRRVINDMEKERGVEGVTPELRARVQPRIWTRLATSGLTFGESWSDE